MELKQTRWLLWNARLKTKRLCLVQQTWGNNIGRVAMQNFAALIFAIWTKTSGHVIPTLTHASLRRRLTLPTVMKVKWRTARGTCLIAARVATWTESVVVMTIVTKVTLATAS